MRIQMNGFKELTEKCIVAILIRLKAGVRWICALSCFLNSMYRKTPQKMITKLDNNTAAKILSSTLTADRLRKASTSNPMLTMYSLEFTSGASFSAKFSQLRGLG